jgi:hypothetical protein
MELHPDGTRCDHIRVARPVPCLRVPEAGAVSISALGDTVAGLGLDPDCPRERQPFVHVIIARAIGALFSSQKGVDFPCEGSVTVAVPR